MATFAKKFQKNPLYYLHMIFFCHLGMKIHSPRKEGCHIIEYSFQNWIIFSTGVIVGTLCNWGDDKTMHYVSFGPTYNLRNVKWLFCWLCAVDKTLSFAFGGFLVCQYLGPSIFYLFLPLLWVLCFIDDWQVFIKSLHVGVGFGQKILTGTWPIVWVKPEVLCVHMMDGHVA
jgi:hypothetical protein